MQNLQLESLVSPIRGSGSQNCPFVVYCRFELLVSIISSSDQRSANGGDNGNSAVMEDEFMGFRGDGHKMFRDSRGDGKNHA